MPASERIGGAVNGARWLYCLAALAVAGNLSPDGGIPGLSTGIVLLAGAAVAVGTLRLGDAEAGWADWAGFLLACALATFPHRVGAAIAPLALAVPLRGRAPGLATLLMMLSLAALYGGGANLVAPHILRLEAETVGWLLRLAGYDVAVADNMLDVAGTGHTLMIVGGCSASLLLPELAVVTLALCVLLHEGTASGWRAVAGAAAAGIVLNLARLCAMALSPAHTVALHGPAGQAVQQFVAVLIALAAVLLLERRRR